MAHVDDTVVFERMVKNCCGSFDGFLEDFREFQRVTCTSSYAYASMTAKQLIWERKFGRKLTLPERFSFYFIKYWRNATTIRLQNIVCPAFVGIRAGGREYRVMKRCLVHNLDFYVGQRGLYVGSSANGTPGENDIRVITYDASAQTVTWLEDGRSTNHMAYYLLLNVI
ncbi:unnamed protein product [Echinostoma caproni]|uniref:Retrotransposon protein n=1 Tax=Echinostoma caproni TaxID=27848 RepID=A0A183B1S1_9TREM|nr:unnamed protein product [Echinostoma caproni]